MSQGGEGSFGEHITSIYSDDEGITWQGPFSIENPAGVDNGVPNAYAIVVRSMIESENMSRIFAIYNLNVDNITKPTIPGRDDELGYFYMRYSDDGGESWSKNRWRVEYPRTWIDRNNKPFSSLNMTTNIMWTVDHVKVKNKTAYFAFTKIGTYVQNPPEEIFVMKSSDLLLEEGMKDDLSSVSWIMLPNDEDHGVRSPKGFNPNTTVMEEGHVLPLSSGKMHIIARTSVGYVASTTRDKDLSSASSEDGEYSRFALYVVCSSFNHITYLCLLKWHSRIAHSSYYTRSLEYQRSECGLDCDENSNTNARTQVHVFQSGIGRK